MFDANIYILIEGGTAFDKKYGCAKKEMCDCPSFDLCFFPIRNVFIDQAIREPRHGKDLVNGLNAR